ncbi:uncharacterized protein LOC113764959 [Coffea eugenioides]|uniref:uncharacterized protein LOC113764959 n=1 Tax=Coffea eugenioides TaxID=49369 RepID=UPI000F611D41|nr:uncharacterized protein LOC113764959 [Coffea eugenioides]
MELERCLGRNATSNGGHLQRILCRDAPLPTNSPRPAPLGGIIRDEAGHWLGGFSVGLGTASNILAELWAILRGLQLAWEKGYRKVIIESDSKAGMGLIEVDRAWVGWLLLMLKNVHMEETHIICYETQKWGLLSKYAKRFIKAGGVNLRQATIDMWMEFAAKRGDVDSLWKVEKLRSESKKQHTLASGFSCAKGFLLESKPESAAAVIEELNQSLSDGKRQGMLSQLQKLVSEWPLEVMEHQKKEHKKDVAAALQKSIPAMIVSLSSIGAEVNVNLDDLTTKAGILS